MTDLCELCGEPMPAGEEMFKYHGYSGPCQRPPKPHKEDEMSLDEYVRVLRFGHRAHIELARLLKIEAAATELADYVRPNSHKHITEINLINAVG